MKTFYLMVFRGFLHPGEEARTSRTSELLLMQKRKNNESKLTALEKTLFAINYELANKPSLMNLICCNRQHRCMKLIRQNFIFLCFPISLLSLSVCYR